MQLLMIIASIRYVHTIMESLTIIIMPDKLQNLLTQYPRLICSLYTAHEYVLAGLVAICILVFQIFLQLKPFVYLEINHEQFSIAAFSLIFLTEIIQLCIMLYVTGGSLCARQKFQEFVFLNKFEIVADDDLQELLFVPPMAAFNGLMLLALEIMFLSVKFLQWRKSKSQIGVSMQVFSYDQRFESS